MSKPKTKILVSVSWVKNSVKQQDSFLIQTAPITDKEEISAAVDIALNYHAADYSYDINTQSWYWSFCKGKLKPGELEPRFESISIDRLKILTQFVSTPKYEMGQIVGLKPDSRNEFCEGTLGIILGIQAYNDSEDNKPYTGYTVQVVDDPPGKHNDNFNGFAYEPNWTVAVYESQIIKTF